MSILSRLSVGLLMGLLFLSPNLSSAQGECLTGGCAFGGSQFPSGTLTSTSTYSIVAANIYAGEYQLYNVVAGTTYDWSYCAADGGATTADLQLTLFNNATQTVLCYSDDFCGNAPKITWTATFTGVVRVLTNQYNCATNSSSQTLVWRGIAPTGGGGSGECLAGGCTFGGTQFPLGTLNSSTGFTLVAANIYAGEYQLYNVVAGTTYDWSYCAADGGATTADLQLTLFNEATQAIICYSDDFCGNAPKITWTATFTGVVRLLTNQYNCATNTSNQTLVWRGVPPSGPANSNCGNAIALSCNQVVTGTTVGASVDVVSVCGTATAPTAPGVWYTIVGTGGPLTVNTCTGTSFDTQISVFDGLCGSLVCVTGNDDDCAAASSVTWNSVSGTIYRILVHGYGGASGTFSLTVVSPITASITGNTSVCAGASTTLTASGGSSYVWSTGVTVPSTTVSPSTTTTYQVTVSNALGCVATTSQTVNVVAPSNPASISGPTAICAGQTATLSGNAGANSYLWNTGASTPSITVNPTVATTYSLTATDANGCTSTASFNLGINAAPMASISGASLLCLGSSTTLSASGGNSYIWENGFTGPSRVVTGTTLGSNVYSVTVTGANSCSATASFSLQTTEAAAVSIQGPNGVCQGETATLSALGAAGNTYNWSTTQSGTSINVAPSTQTTYSLTATDLNGCTTTASTTLNVSAPITASISGAGSICEGESLTLIASGGDVYVWSNGETTSSITVSPSSSTDYQVTASSNGCAATASVLVTVNASPSLSVSGPMSICQGQTANLEAAGNGNFVWSTGQMSSVISVQANTTTTYTVSLTDANGCSTQIGFMLNVNALPSLNITPASVNICQGDNVSFTVSGAGNYNWNVGVNGATLSAQPSITTTYTVTGTDANGCSATASATANVSGGSSVAISEAGCNSELTVNLNGGTYLWSTGASTQSIIPTGDAVYSVTATDANGCSGTASLPFTQVGSFSLSLDSITNTGSSNSGAIQIAVSGGRAPYSFNWSNGSNNQNLSNLAPGTYAVTATDARGCSQTGSYTVQLLSAIETNEALANWTVFPNPTRHTVQIRSSLLDEVLEYSLFDAQGRLLQAAKLPAQTGGQWQIQLQDYPEGMYFLRLQQGEQVRTERLMILQP